MSKPQQGFSVVVLLLFVVIIGLVSGIGYFVYNQNKTSKATTANVATETAKTTTPATSAGTTASIDTLTAQDATTESSIDSKYANDEQATAASTNTATSNLGGSFDESTL